MALDPVDAKAVKGKFKDREDKDINNDGKTDSSDEFLHKRRAAISKAIAKEAKMSPEEMKKALDAAKAQSKDKVSLKKAPWDMKKEEADLEEKYDTPAKKKPVSMMSKDEKDENDERRKSYKDYQKSVRKEAVELDEDVSKMSHGRLKWHMNTGVPHGSFTKAEMKAERDRRLKTGEGEAYRNAKAGLNESVVLRVLERMTEAKDSYTIAHKTFSSAVQHAEEVTKKRGYEIDPEEWDRKVSMGPRKPGTGKTNSYSIDLTKNGKDVKQKLHMQVYYDEGRYELNMYIS